MRYLLGKSGFIMKCLLMAVVLLFVIYSPASAQLNENCTVSVLNRTASVRPNGSWTLPNAPANMGLVRARVTCVDEENNVTISGQSDYFTITENGITNVSEIKFDNDYEQVPSSLEVISNKPKDVDSNLPKLTSAGETDQLIVKATYPDSSIKDVTAAGTGTSYTISNPAIATVSAEGLVTAVTSGTVIVSASNEMVLSSISIMIELTGDSDGDGLPDDYELDNNLNPNNPADASEDTDGDGLTNLEEYGLGTKLNNPDTDGDGITDSEEIVAGVDGYITNPLLEDSDGDGIWDGLEVSVSTDPTDSSSFDLSASLDHIDVTPTSFIIIFNTINTEATQQLTVTGTMTDGNTFDLTSTGKGSNYNSSDLTIASFGSTDGLIYAGQGGTATITVSNNGFTDTALAITQTFSPTVLSYEEIPGSANNVDISGNYAYVAAGSAGLQVVDVTDRNNPAVVASEDTPGNANDVKVVGSLAFIADGTSGLQIMDISNPLDPDRLVPSGFKDTLNNAQDVVVAGNLAYIADMTGLKVIDISVPASPIIFGSVDTPGNAYGIDVNPTTSLAVIADGGVGIQVIDISVPANPTISGSVDTGDAWDVVLQDNFAFVADYRSSFTSVDISDPVNPVVRSSTPRATGGLLKDAALSGRFAFGADIFFVNGVPIINISTPDTPIPQVTLDFSSFRDDDGTGIAVDSNYVYLTASKGSSSRLYIGQYLDITDNAGTPPTVNINSPLDGDSVIEGATLPISVNAEDDVAVVAVELLIDGVAIFTDTSPPYQFNYAVPEGITGFIIEARAIDLANNAGTSSDVGINVIPDPLTTITGRAVDINGTPMEDVTVSFRNSSNATTDSFGVFTINGVPTIFGDIVVDASKGGNSAVYIGQSSGIPAVPGGTTDIGDVTMNELFLNNGLVANYPFNMNANDESGNGNHGSVHGAALVEDRFGNINSAYYLDGVDDYIDIGKNVQPPFPVSVSVWINANDLDANGCGIAGIVRNDQYDDGRYRYGLTVRVNGGYLSAHYFEGFSAPRNRIGYTSDDALITAGNWYHLVVKFNAHRNIQLFVNGVEYPGSYSGTGSGLSYSGSNGAIGTFKSNRPDRTCYFNGTIDDLRFYNRALSENEARALFSNLLPDLIPAVSITEPTACGVDVLEGVPLSIKADATDNIGIKSVTFKVNGQELSVDTTPPYLVNTTIPIGITEYDIEAIAEGLFGKTNTATCSLSVVPDPIPAVSITEPAVCGVDVIEGVLLSIKADATDNTGITSVTFNANGQELSVDTTPPYLVNTTIPTGITVYDIEAIAEDLLGKTNTVACSLNVISDPLTTVIGRVVDSNGLSVSGATVTTVNNLTATAISDGTFSIPDVPTISGSISVNATSVINRFQYSGSVTGVAVISGGTTNVGPITIVAEPDTDNDGMPDSYESSNGLNPNDPLDAEQDPDGDGLSNLKEFENGTGLNNPDTDGDGIPDGPEVANGLNPMDPVDALEDADGDVLTNLQEYGLCTDLNNPDTDGDGIPDGFEVANVLNPCGSGDASEDADGDGLTNLQEYGLGTGLNNSDTDGDGLLDGQEVDFGSDPLANTPDPLTTVIGRVVDTNGLTVEGAAVTTVNNLTATTIDDGTFLISGVPAALGNIRVTTTATISGNVFKGFSSAVLPILGGSTDVGEIVVADRLTIWEIDHGFHISFQSPGTCDGCEDSVLCNDCWYDRALPFVFNFFGLEYTNVYVSANGRLTFDRGDSEKNESLAELFEQPQIAPFFDDLTDLNAEPNLWVNDTLPGKFVVTWLGAPHSQVPGSTNYVQVVLYEDGSIQFGYITINGSQGTLVGISPGTSDGATSIDLGADTPYSSIGPVAVSEYFGTFDLANWFVIFTPNVSGGYDVITTLSESDIDGDGMPDGFEDANGLYKYWPGDAGWDLDWDGLTNLEEYRLGTDLRNPDTDGDGMTDGQEDAAGTDPLVPTPSIDVDPSELSFTGVEGVSNQIIKEFEVNNGGVALSWTASVDVSWITLYSTSGNLDPGSSVTVNVTADTSGMTPGTYTANITVNAPDAFNSPQTVAATLTVFPDTGRGNLFARKIVAADDHLLTDIANNPANQEAQFSRSITRLLRIVEQNQDGNDPATFTDSLKEMMDRFGYTQVGRSIFDFTTSPPEDAEEHTVLPSNSPTGSDIQEFFRNIILPEINGAIAENLVAIDSLFSFVVSIEEMAGLGISDDTPIEIDFGDVKLLEALLSGLKATILTTLAYNIDMDIDQANNLGDNLEIQQDIIDANPSLLRLNADGAALLAQAKAAIIDGINAYLAGSAFIRAETDDQNNDFITIEVEDLLNEASIRADLEEIKNSLSGGSPTVTIGNTLVNIGQLFDFPFDLRGYIPPIEFSPERENYIVPGTFPDPTFNGILPGMTQEELADDLDIE